MLEGFVQRMAEKPMVVGLVKQMKPLDVVRVLADDLGLSPKDASRLALDLIKTVEGLGIPAIERGQYPVPPEIRRDNEKDEHIARPQGKSDMTPKFIVRRHQFPPDASNEPDDWPFDDHTKAGMNPKNRSPKRGLTASKDNSDTRKRIKKGNPFDPDLTINQPGGDGAGGGGIYQKTNPANTGGNMPGAGNNSWVAKGTKGFNSMPGKEFEVPPSSNRKKPKKVGETERPPNAGDDDDEPKFLKQPNTGASSSVANLGYGGRTPARLSKAGYRGYGRK